MTLDIATTKLFVMRMNIHNISKVGSLNGLGTWDGDVLCHEVEANNHESSVVILYPSPFVRHV